MPILTITLKGEELKSKTVNLHDPLNLRYFKLLHVNHNLLGESEPRRRLRQRRRASAGPGQQQ